MEVRGLIVLFSLYLTMIVSRLTVEHPEHPVVVNVAKKAELFEQCMAMFEVPSIV